MDHEELKAKYIGLQKQLAQVGYICNGTVMSMYRKCGKSNCGCKDDPKKKHGPYHIWTRKEKGKTVTRSLSRKQADLCSDYMVNFKKMENIMEEMKEISIQIIEKTKKG